MKRRRTVAISLATWAAIGIGLSRLLEIVLAPPGDGFVEEGEVAGRFDIVAERLQRPDDDVAMRLPILNGGIGLEHEPLRPVAAFLVLLGEDDAQNRLGRLVVLERQKQFQADPGRRRAMPQAPPEYCSRPCGAVRWIIASCASHGKIASMALASAACQRS